MCRRFFGEGNAKHKLAIERILVERLLRTSSSHVCFYANKGPRRRRSLSI